MEPIPEITAEELKQRLENGEKLEVVDVREEEEVAGGKIPQARHIVMGTIPEHLDQFDKEKEYIFVCRSGRRSENVCYYMRDQGFKVRNMTGGMLDWTGETE
ncbi:rhodanese-like domain-containing protein [Bacillus badius]|uniref:rhodanese-like domain-containing protein n=1 Tax=Bacillus badius TaxID=1455 RepID=UPI0007B09B63|nr:rhodanese-like domain-containing protein [Bacillus badius]KZO01390.1 rhodanese-like domain-containing protein [Bacillus badius]MED0665246.1 rhodanese-like domain-containing protein [Bacillus badius]OCS89725.1 rhodanese-like domain-containing protein [Bacillus badius]OVE51066.1 rhodanese-like domain-containing protein [Bacillus badius]TDW01961.1 rhodanese-related sulfurtransferase [Bacillus badius]